MATLSDDKKSIIIGIAGLYRVTAVLNWNAHNVGSAGSYFAFKINGNVVTQKWAGRTGGFGTIDRIFNFNQGDKVGFFVNTAMSNTGMQYSSFTLHKL